ncbi:MAG: N-acetylmuramoyl-L-alanine amidase, partial [Gemmatimonadaceae bacterium]
ASQDSRIPAVDAPLVIAVRYPRDGVREVGDSVAVWGSVGTGRATLLVNTMPVMVERNGTFSAFVKAPSAGSRQMVFVARRGSDSARKVVTLQHDEEAKPIPPNDVRSYGAWVRMRRLPSDTADRATQVRPIYSRWRPRGNVALPLVQGMRLLADAQTDSAIRLVVASDVRVWVTREDATNSPPRQRLLAAGALLLARDSSGVTLSIPVSEPLPFTVELSGDRLLWTVFGATWKAPPRALDGAARIIRRAVPHNETRGRITVDLGLNALPIGWKGEWRDGAMRLRVRQAHVAANGVRGLRILLDPGHPPDGSTGPGGLAEDSVTLAVARAAAARLQSLGADVSLTRRDARRLSVEARAAMIDERSPELFVSIHANSPGPGRPPGAVDRTVVYWSDPHAIWLARAMAQGVGDALQQPTRGNSQGEYAVLRSAWATSVLVEGFGLVLPEREAFMRSGAGIDAYARGIVDGIVKWSTARQSHQLPSPDIR